MWARFEAHRHSLELGFATVFVHAGAHHAVLGDLARPRLRQSTGQADPPPDPRRRRGRFRQPHVQVPTRRSDGDLGHLGDTFNKMTAELLRQQTGLIEANALNDERRAFIEAVLSGVPAGVLGVDNDGIVTISNAAADRLLGGDLGLIGRPLIDVQPSIASIWEQARSLQAQASSRAGDRPAGRPRARSQRSRHRKSRTRRSGQRHHARRHQRSRHRATHRRLGRRRPPHRA